MTSWFVNCAKDNQRASTKHGSESLLQSECRRMELQTELVTLQRDQRLSRVVRLQSRWQELSEMECRAQLQNRQLMQAFDRAQDTLRDMVTRNAAMNTIRVEYERHLEGSYPRWQQQFNEKKLLAQRKRREQQLMECLRRMEEDLGEGRVAKNPKEAQPSLSSSHANILQNTTPPQDQSRQNGHQDYIQDSSILSNIQSSWLVQACSQLSDYHTRMPYNCQRGDLSRQPSVLFRPYDPQPLSPIQPYPVQHPPQSYSIPTGGPHIRVRQETLPTGYPMPRPSIVAAEGHPFIVSGNTQTFWTSPSMPNTNGRRMVEGEDKDSEEQEDSAAPSSVRESTVGKTQRTGGRKHPTHELDIKPVRLSTGHGETSENSSRSSSQASKESVSRRGGRQRKGNAGRPGQRYPVGSGEVSLSPSLVQSSEADESSPEAQGNRGIRQPGGQENALRPEGPGSPRERLTGQRASEDQQELKSIENVRESNEEATGMEEECLETAKGCEGEERGGEETEEDEEGSAEVEEASEEEEQCSHYADENSAGGECDNEEEHDSDDSIISPPGNRSCRVLAEEEEEEEVICDDDDGKDGQAGHDGKAKVYSWSADPCPEEDDDIESLLAPILMSQGNKEEEKNEKAMIKAEAISEDFENDSEVKAVDKKTKANQETESDESDHFYD
ncbi:hypothetical protein UPYG_G00212110 [Umbra pygmaea]|uniref:Uncharacterized protein n=1 Tax=Umbra pygmaea TaxID=75934 RepID=A0ABD0WKF0_UMBPY